MKAESRMNERRFSAGKQRVERCAPERENEVLEEPTGSARKELLKTKYEDVARRIGRSNERQRAG